MDLRNMITGISTSVREQSQCLTEVVISPGSPDQFGVSCESPRFGAAFANQSAQVDVTGGTV